MPQPAESRRTRLRCAAPCRSTSRAVSRPTSSRVSCAFEHDLDVALERAVLGVETEAPALIVGGAGGQHRERHLLGSTAGEDGARDLGKGSIAAHRDQRTVAPLPAARVSRAAITVPTVRPPAFGGDHELVRDPAAASSSDARALLDALGVETALRGGVADEEDLSPHRRHVRWTLWHRSVPLAGDRHAKSSRSRAYRAAVADAAQAAPRDPCARSRRGACHAPR